MLSHRIDAGHLAALLCIKRCHAEQIIHARRCRPSLGAADRTRLRMFANILIRLEWRFQHDSAAIRRALETPIGVLDVVAPADLFGGSLEDLLAVRRAIDAIETPKVKWWRVGH